MVLAFAETVRSGGIKDEIVWSGPAPTELVILSGALWSIASMALVSILYFF